MGFAMGRIQRKSTRGKFREAIARAPVFGLGQWDTAEWTADPTLAKTVLAVLQAPDETTREPLLEALARDPLFVTVPVASPEVRAVLAELDRTPEGPVIRREWFPQFYLWAVRVACTEVRAAYAKVRAEHAAPATVQVAEFRGRAMRYVRELICSLPLLPNPTDAMAHLGSLSLEEAAKLDGIMDEHPPLVRDNEPSLADVVFVLQRRGRDRDLELIKLLGEDTWRPRAAIMLGVSRGAMRMRWMRWLRRRKRDAARRKTRPVRSRT
jgi:hypothetical protein